MDRRTFLVSAVAVICASEELEAGKGIDFKPEDFEA